MDKWICKKCGTICSDWTTAPDLPLDVFEKLSKERQKIEDKGEMYKLYCLRCKEERM